MPSEPKNAADLSPAVVRVCDSCHQRVPDGCVHVCSASPVSVPEERQDDRVAKRLAEFDIGAMIRAQAEVYWQTAKMQRERGNESLALLNAGRGDRCVQFASALDALAVAVKPVQEQWAAQLNVRIGDMDALVAAITALLDGRTTTNGE